MYWPKCRGILNNHVTACHGKVNISKEPLILGDNLCDYEPHCAGPRDLYVASFGRHPADDVKDEHPEKWELPFAEFDTPARGPWEREGTCATMNWGGIQDQAKHLCRCKCSRDVSRGAAEYAKANDEDDTNLLFLSWHYELRNWVREFNLHEGAGAYWRFKQPSTGILDGGRDLCAPIKVDSTQRYVDRFWQDQIMHLCSRPSVVDTWSYTRTLTHDLPEEAVKMTRDGFHWGRAVSVITAHKVIRRHLELLDERSGQDRR